MIKEEHEDKEFSFLWLTFWMFMGLVTLVSGWKIFWAIVNILRG